LIWVLAVVVPVYSTALYLSFRAAAERLDSDAVAAADDLAARLATGLDALIRPIEGGVRTIAFQLEEIDPPQFEYEQRIRGLLNAWPEVYGSTIAVEGRRDETESAAFAPYLYRRGGEIRSADLATEEYAYRELDWYRKAADGLQPVWSAPYYDDGGGEAWMVTYSVPYFRRPPDGDRVLAGVVTADLDLDWVLRAAAGVSLGPHGVGWLTPVDPASEFIAPIGTTTERLADFPVDAAAARKAGEGMLAQRVTFGSWDGAPRGEAAYLAVRELGTLGWHLSLVLPREALLADARQLLRIQIGLGLIGLFVLLGAIALVATGIARPIRRLAEAVSGAAVGGDLGFALPEASRRDEVGVLTAALRRLRDSLQEHVRLRAESLAGQARLEHELEVSARIQQSMLPHDDSFRALPSSIEIAVVLHPARQVGGDLYDCFPLADGRVLFLVGDVSDKGIPAALFMARLSALLRVLGAGGHSPDRLFAEINGRLVAGNDTCMFVTAVCGLLDPATGRFRLASAGHDPPLLRTFEGRVLPLDVETGAAIGIDPGADYPLHDGVMAPGDTLVLFTDGVTEAESAQGALFGIERLTTLLGDGKEPTPAALIASIVEQVAKHAAGHHASDDLTAMALRFRPADVASRLQGGGTGWLIQVEPSEEGLGRATQRLRAILEARQVGDESIHDAELLAEEWLSNVIRAGASASGRTLREITLDVVVTTEQIALVFRDDGAPFDPLTATPPDLDAELAERGVGGLGLHLIRELADACLYERRDGCNILRLGLDRTAES
jgi:sigma-B regulation protein RsbU (phosphoserine phosphatase)